MVVVAGALAQKPTYGGHAWVFLQYLLGFRRLGFDVLFLDRLEPDMAIDDDVGLAHVRHVLEPFGLGDNFAIFCDRGSRTLGLTREAVVERTRSSVLLLNVMGFLVDEEILAAAPRRVFFDIDPGFSQMWRELGMADVISGHDLFLTLGENIGLPECAVPTCGLDWITTRQPIVLDEWPTASSRGPFTTVGAWRGPFAPIEYGGRTYGLRVHEFRRFAALPRITGQAFEIALDIDAGEVRDIELLGANGWALVDPGQATQDPAAYRAFIQHSDAEFAVAKNMYVQARTGWFSDRSACYLASAKPVLFQDTGLAGLYPVGEGLLIFDTLEDAISGVEAISGDYPRHARAAREIAEDLFDSRKVLSGLLDKLVV
jgi:hypothetical protein